MIPVSATGSGIAPDSPKLSTASSAVAEVTLSNMTYANSGVLAITVRQADRTELATTVGSTKWVRYSFTLSAGAAGVNNTMTLSGFHPVTFKYTFDTNDSITGGQPILRAPLTSDDITNVYTLTVPIDPADGHFHIVKWDRSSCWRCVG